MQENSVTQLLLCSLKHLVGLKASGVALIVIVSYFHCLSQLQEMRQCELCDAMPQEFLS